jgi:hypothetical protein
VLVLFFFNRTDHRAGQTVTAGYPMSDVAERLKRLRRIRQKITEAAKLSQASAKPDRPSTRKSLPSHPTVNRPQVQTSHRESNPVFHPHGESNSDAPSRVSTRDPNPEPRPRRERPILRESNPITQSHDSALPEPSSRHPLRPEDRDFDLFLKLRSVILFSARRQSAALFRAWHRRTARPRPKKPMAQDGEF